VSTVNQSVARLR